MRISLLLSFAATAAFAAFFTPVDAAFAQSTKEADRLEQLVVTATRVETPLSRISDSVTIIEAREVRDSQATTVSDLLATTPGVTVSRNGGLGTATSLRIRGAEADHTVVLIDGVKLNDPSSTGGGYNFGNLLTSDVARIEVLRGPQSTLWGSQAIAGVVNLVTPTPEGPLSARMSGEAGARGTMDVGASIESGGERLAWRVGGSYLGTDGISALDEDYGGAERDGFRSVGWHARADLKLSHNISAQLRTIAARSRFDFDGFPPPTFAFADTREYGNSEEIVSYAGLNASSFGGRLQNRMGFSYTDTDRENFDPGSPIRRTFDAFGRNERWEYEGALDVTRDINAVFGIESERSRLSTASPTASAPNPAPLARSVSIDSAYVQAQISPVHALTLIAGLRRDDHETFGSNVAVRTGAAWSVSESTTLRANYGEGFKAPTLYQLYSQYGNLGLRPERAEGWDVGIAHNILHGALSASATYFRRDTDNMIDFVSCRSVAIARCIAQPLGYYDNIRNATADGVEIELAARLGERLSLTGNYTAMQAENATRGTADFGRSLPRRPRETANLTVSYQWPMELITAVAVQRAGRSYDNAANTRVLDGYTLVDLRAAYSFPRAFEVYARLENIFDRDHATTWRYGSLGRGAFFGLRHGF